MVILAAVDEEPKSTDVISVGYELATAYHETLVVLHVVPEEKFEDHRDAITSTPDFPDFSFTQEEDSAAQFAGHLVDNTLEDHTQELIETEGRVGSPVNEILEAADQHDTRYIVIGGRRRSPVGKALFGSTTQSVLLNADVPVMTVMVGD